MAYAFDENLGKVQIQPILDQLETNYQANINKVYNAIVSQGTNPAGRTPDQIVAAINTMASAKYSSGYSAGNAAGQNTASSIRWTQTFKIFIGEKDNTSGPVLIPLPGEVEMGLKNVVSGSISSNVSEYAFKIYYLNASGGQISVQNVAKNANPTLSIPSNAVKMLIASTSDTGGKGVDCNLTLTYQTKVLRS